MLKQKQQIVQSCKIPAHAFLAPPGGLLTLFFPVLWTPTPLLHNPPLTPPWPLLSLALLFRRPLCLYPQSDLTGYHHYS